MIFYPPAKGENISCVDSKGLKLCSKSLPAKNCPQFPCCAATSEDVPEQLRGAEPGFGKIWGHSDREGNLGSGEKNQKFCLQEAKQGEARPSRKSQVQKMLLGFPKFP